MIVIGTFHLFPVLSDHDVAHCALPLHLGTQVLNLVVDPEPVPVLHLFTNVRLVKRLGTDLLVL